MYELFDERRWRLVCVVRREQMLVDGRDTWMKHGLCLLISYLGVRMHVKNWSITVEVLLRTPAKLSWCGHEHDVFVALTSEESMI